VTLEALRDSLKTAIDTADALLLKHKDETSSGRSEAGYYSAFDARAALVKTLGAVDAELHYLRNVKPTGR